MAFTTAYSQSSASFLAITTVISTISLVKNQLGMLKPFFEQESEVSSGKEVLTKISGGVELSHVSFRYTETSPDVLSDISLKIRPQEYVAIVGETGCGKSTLMRLLLGFEVPQKGAVYYDGKDIANLDLKSLRKGNIGVVLQNGSLFSGDIYSNIVISAPWLTVEEAWEAAEVAGIADDIRAMPMGMHTLISEGSGGVSGGQKQRLMIARAVAPKPKLIILDEATSALDNITQKHVSDSLKSLKCTRIVIAHRLSTIKNCDKIFYLENGQITEQGTYEQLLNLNGRFTELVKRQLDYSRPLGEIRINN
jgi:ABC-type bacteriocin/lantibiotic exporter with double-glycine peptidase domain